MESITYFKQLRKELETVKTLPADLATRRIATINTVINKIKEPDASILQQASILKDIYRQYAGKNLPIESPTVVSITEKSVEPRLLSVIPSNAKAGISSVAGGAATGGATAGAHNLVESTPVVVGDMATTSARLAVPAANTRAMTSAGAASAAHVGDMPATAVLAETLPIAGCLQLYDPCSRILLPDFASLELRVREIKKGIVAATAPKVFPSTVVSRLDLLLYFLNLAERPSIDLLNYSKSGNLYEAYWDIAITFGMVDSFPITDKFFLYSAKAEEILRLDDPRFTNNRMDYLRGRKVMSGATGVSDITFLYREHRENTNRDECSFTRPVVEEPSPALFFCSSKYYKKDATKGVDKFDIQNIVTAFKDIPGKLDRRIVLLVNNRTAVESVLRNAMRTYISEKAQYVFGVEDLIACLTKFYDMVRTIHPTGDITESIVRAIFGLEAAQKPALNLRLHQHIAVDGISSAIRQFTAAPVGKSNNFLVGIVPRGGKTYIAGGLVHTLQPRNVVVLLGAKSETLKQFKGELFEAFSNFNAYTCIDVREETTTYAVEPSKKYIFIMSIELFKTESTTRVLLQKIKKREIPIDLFICDEAHLKQTTARAAGAMQSAAAGGAAAATVEEEVVEGTDAEEVSGLRELDRIISRVSNVPVVYMTGTYIKPLTALKIPITHAVLWDYQDIQKAKQLSSNEEYFRDGFGALYESALAKCLSYGETIASIEKQYQKFPELYLLTTQFTEDAKEAFSKQVEGGVPTLTQLFRVKSSFNPDDASVDPSQWYTGFNDPAGVMRLLNYMCPPSEQLATVGVGADALAIPHISESVMRKIDYIAQSIGDRLGFFTSSFVTHTQLWFLPHMSGHPLKKRMCALASAIFQLPWFRKHFEVVAVSSSVDWRTVPRASDKHILISGHGGGVPGVFGWKCPDPANEYGLKGCLVDVEAAARQKGKGMIILAQNMLHLGISLKCVDIVVLLDDGKKVDERIQKMYRALTESTNKKGGYIVDMNYFRTVTALTNYAITQVKARSGRRVVSEGIKDIFKNVLNTYSFDIDNKNTLEASVERDLPELQRLLGGSRRTGGDSIVVTNAGSALNANIDVGVGDDYATAYEGFLGKVRESLHEKKLLRAGGTELARATAPITSAGAATGGAGTSVAAGEELSEEEIVSDLLNPTATAAQKRAAYVDIFKTTLKYGVFGTNAPDVHSLIEKLKTDKDTREIVYSTLVVRGTIIEDTTRREEQKGYLINALIIPGLEKLIASKKNASYTGMKEVVDDTERYPKEIRDVLEYVAAHLAPKDVERHKFGEVFTPMDLVNEMLDTLNGTDVWNNGALKWLDPANGMGNFPIAVFIRLYNGFRTVDGKFEGPGREGPGTYNPGLTDIIKDDASRKMHIIENMLFMIELNSKNIAISRRLFTKLAPDATPNIIQVDRRDGFLADKPFVFPNGTVNQFDIVMGNPPFQGGAAKGKSTSKTRKHREELGVEQGKHRNLWIPFVQKILTTHLKKDGYLLFIHPIGWFKPERTGIHDLMLKHQLHTIRIYDMYQSMRRFSGKGKISVAYYLLENKPVTSKTIIIDRLERKESLQLTEKTVLILAFNSIFSKIQAKSPLFFEGDDHKVTSIPSNKCASGDKKQIHRISEKGDITFVKTSNVHPDQSVPKLILSGYHSPRFYFDKTGEYGLIGSHQNYFKGPKLEKLDKFFNTKLSAVLLKHAKYDQEYIEPGYYPDIRDIPLDSITDETLATYYGFTDRERAQIEETVYPPRVYTLKEISCAVLRKEHNLEGGGVRRTRKIHRHRS